MASKDYHSRDSLVPQAFRLGATLIKAIAAVSIAWVAGDTLKSIAESLAGKITLADVQIGAEGNINIPAYEKVVEILDKSCWWAGVIGVLLFLTGIGYGVRQRNLRRANIERLSKRVKELEECCDTGRSSSGLTPKGETNPEDT